MEAKEQVICNLIDAMHGHVQKRSAVDVEEQKKKLMALLSPERIEEPNDEDVDDEHDEKDRRGW